MSDTPLSDLAADLLRWHLAGTPHGTADVPGAAPDQVRRAYAELVGGGLLRPCLYQLPGHLPVLDFTPTDACRAALQAS